MEWIIAKDHINKGAQEVSRVGVGSWKKATRESWSPGSTKRSDFTLEQRAAFAQSLPYEFQLYDDDGELYYEGKCGDITDAPEHLAFAPLDYGMADAGCTTLKYRKAGVGKWEVL